MYRNQFRSSRLGSDTSWLISLALAYQWYLSCRALHKQCNQLYKRPKWHPTRLLDIGVQGESTWKLQICSEDQLLSPNYLTLSYRWGSLPCLMLTSSNLDELRRGRLIKDLPRTFRDVIIVARWFSIRYLWIDSLCILQDSQEDWQEESSAMGNVYANSSCNVAAAASADPHGGLFRSQECGDIQPGLLELGCSDLSRKKYFIFNMKY